MKKVIIATLLALGLATTVSADTSSPNTNKVLAQTKNTKADDNWLEKRSTSLCAEGKLITADLAKGAQAVQGARSNTAMTGCYLVGPIAGRVNVVTSVIAGEKAFTIEQGFLLAFDEKTNEWELVKGGTILFLDMHANKFSFSVQEE